MTLGSLLYGVRKFGWIGAKLNSIENGVYRSMKYPFFFFLQLKNISVR